MTNTANWRRRSAARFRSRMTTPLDILSAALERARTHLNSPLIENQEVVSRIETVCRYLQNRACTRFILACTLAKADRPHIDIRKPYTEIHDDDVYLVFPDSSLCLIVGFRRTFYLVSR